MSFAIRAKTSHVCMSPPGAYFHASGAALMRRENQMSTITAREHLNWCVRRAMEYFDSGDLKNAKMSYLSGVSKHPGTSWIQRDPFITPMILHAPPTVKREELVKLMEGFNVSD